MRTIQYDPLNKVGRNPDLVLQSRISDYKPYLLKDLLYKDRKLIDGWDKNRSIYLIEDWPFFERYRIRSVNRNRDNRHIGKIIDLVRQTIHNKGPLSSIDLEFDKKIDWSWSPTRAARATLESMQTGGELIIFNRIGTRKIYDFTEKHLPDVVLNQPDPNKTDEDFIKWLVYRRIGSIGLMWNRSGDGWLGFHDIKKKDRSRAISELLKEGKLIDVSIEDINTPFYIKSDKEELLKSILIKDQNNKKAFIIAPLDNLLWDRKLVKELFGFEYVWEVYKPANERQFGYYVLPILYNDKFIARFEPVYNSKKKELVVKNWWWELGINQKNFIDAIKDCLKDFMKYLGATKIKIYDKKIAKCLDDYPN
ncbi:MAG: winged helix DNA-binding domain-containing protein [Kosmotogaceae bacterium]